MAKCYFELRKQAARGTDSTAADMMRHLYARQHLGRVVIVSEQPTVLHAAARKQWLRLGRSIQKQRASTLNADKILKYTHTITHMQHMRFSVKTPMDDPEADIYFLDANSCRVMPVHCYSVYVDTQLRAGTARDMLRLLPSEALVIDYRHRTPWGTFGLQSKVVLETHVDTEWESMQQFMHDRHIEVSHLVKGQVHDIEGMDDALDSLLDVSQKFLQIANEFQHALELARPLRISKDIRQEYDAVMLLAYRVQALGPGMFTKHFLETYNEDDTFFLFDSAKQRILDGKPFADAIVRHMRAGRYRLAYALQQVRTIR